MKYQDGGLAGRKMARLGAKIRPGGLVSAETKLENKKATEYDKVKKGMTQAFKDKRNLYVNDAPTINKFMDNSTNRADLLEMIYYSVIVPGKWINKEKIDEKTRVTDAITKEINEYKKDVASKTDASGTKTGGIDYIETASQAQQTAGEIRLARDIGSGKVDDNANEALGIAGSMFEGGRNNKPNNKIKTRKNKRYSNNNKTRRNNNNNNT